MIIINEDNIKEIEQYIRLAGLRCFFLRLGEFAINSELRFKNDGVPEGSRVGAAVSEIWTDERGAYTWTIKRLSRGRWALVSAAGEPFKPPSGSLLLIDEQTHKENVTGAIMKTGGLI